MTQVNNDWTNDKILDHFLWKLVSQIYETSEEWLEVTRDSARDDNHARLRDRLQTIQIAVLAD